MNFENFFRFGRNLGKNGKLDRVAAYAENPSNTGVWGCFV